MTLQNGENPLEHLANLEPRTESETSPEPEPEKDPEGEKAPEPTLEEVQKLLTESLDREKAQEQKIKTQEGRTKKATSDRELLEKISDRLGTQEKATKLLMEHTGKGTVEELPAAMAQNEAEAAQLSAQRSQDTQVDGLKTALNSAIHDDTGELLITAAQVKDLALRWKESETVEDLVSLVTDATTMVVSSERTKTEEREKVIRQEERDKVKSEREENGFGELDSGPGAGVSGSTDSMTPLQKISEGTKRGHGKALFD